MTEYTPGMILVEVHCYSMRFYDFYKIERVTAKQIKAVKLKKHYEYTGDDCFHPIVTPTNEIETNTPSDMYLTISKSKAEWKLSVYDRNKKYQEDHLD